MKDTQVLGHHCVVKVTGVAGSKSIVLLRSCALDNTHIVQITFVCMVYCDCFGQLLAFHTERDTMSCLACIERSSWMDASLI